MHHAFLRTKFEKKKTEKIALVWKNVKTEEVALQEKDAFMFLPHFVTFD